MTRVHVSRWGAAAVVAVVVLAAGSTVAIAAGNGGFDRGARGRRCAAPSLPGTVVHVDLGDMGASMTGDGGSPTMMGGPMMGAGPSLRPGMFRITTDRASVRAGPVSFVVTNQGRLTHELLVLPLAADTSPGTRRIGSDGRIDEGSSVGEASRTCGAGEGDGIASTSRGWVTLTLAPGRYELLCNLPAHYGAGMFTELAVS